ncbi:RodZ domain-containing protein [Nocardioides sp. CFH 31398]|uniref:RodZ domain-containing protein n=1 Tax=Nocardioides sp. CFH 31398 TaxID=2919579 RepID=UPI001F06D95C|nr:RodZ domain-containing protein [Nocardioides sp. CFH 31398]MCH1867488.1 helix-turn-helix domain-containing protein [Nocardioides sp. CFH 31398]
MGAAEQYDERGAGPARATGPDTGTMTAVDGERRPPAERPEPKVVEVRRNRVLAGVVGVVAAAIAIAYLGRATTTGAPLDWALTGVTAVLAVAWLWSLLDARTPLLVADAHGVRVRLGRTWEGLPWRGLDRVEHHPRRGLGRDGRIVLVPRATTPLLEGLDGSGRRHARVAATLHGAPFAVPLGLSTRLSGVAADEVGDVLRSLAGADTRIVEPEPAAEPAPEVTDRTAPETEDPDTEVTAPVPLTAPAARVRGPEPEPEPEPAATEHTGDADDTEDTEVPEAVAVPASERRVRDPRPTLARLIAWLSDRDEDRGEDQEQDREQDREQDGDQDDAEPSTGTTRSRDVQHDVTPEKPQVDEVDEVDEVTETPEPARERRAAARSEVRHADVARTGQQPARADDLPEVRALRRPGSVDLVGDDEVWGARVRPIAQGGAPVEPLAIDDFGVEPAADPVVGPELAAARTRLSLSVDQLAERTRIRPHVIESIEVDDFAPCGGDFYARGHLRTLARVLGVDAAPLLAAYDERYSDAPIDPRRVFAAELATGSHGSIRGTRGGPSWSVLVAAVMVVVLAWSVARLVMDDPVDLDPAPALNGSAGPASPAPVADPVPLTITAVNAGATVTVTDGEGEVRFDDDLAMGESTELELAPPVRIQTSDGGAIETTLDGRDNGPLGEAGQPASDTLVPPR